MFICLSEVSRTALAIAGKINLMKTSSEEMNSFDHNKISIYYSDVGTGMPIVLLHAGGSSNKQWRKVKNLLKSGFRLVAPDLIGFGQTSAWTASKDLTHDDQADLVAAVIARCIGGSVHLVGHSYGGSTAIRLCTIRPELVASMVLIEPIATVLLREAGESQLFEDYRSFAQTFIDLAATGNNHAAWKSFIDLRNGPGSWSKLESKAQDRFLSITTQTVDGFKSNLNNSSKLVDCRRISVPTLVACGENTTKPERRVTEILRDELPDCEYAIIAQAEHMSPLTHPTEVAELIAGHVIKHHN